MEYNKSISLRISDKLLNEINEIESDKILDTSNRIRLMLEYAIKKMKDDKLNFKSQESTIIK
jgi:antitoxin component of RelBE/YafQ-DinJ toxin-antitoxin module